MWRDRQPGWHGGAPAARRATLAVITGMVAFLASLGLLVYRQVAPDGESADPTDASDARDTADTTDDTEAPNDRVPADQPTVTNDFYVHDGLTTSDRLQTGDCFNRLNGFPPATPGASVSQLLVDGWTVSVVSCDESHHQEVYYGFTLPAGPYPGDEQAQALAIDQCSVQFRNYVGVAPEESALAFFYVWPDQTYWLQGIRRGGCSLYEASGLNLTGSMRGSQR
jgi:hypothetical protein